MDVKSVRTVGVGSKGNVKKKYHKN